jgi:succinate dehydrogenase / fumarate reductase, cytochrome b subunit
MRGGPPCVDGERAERLDVVRSREGSLLMNSIKLLINSSLGLKFVMAATGAGLVLFLIGHLLGNLQIFLPPEAINRYAHFLQSTPELVWSARLGLLVMVVLHIASAVRLALANRRARPVAYALDPAQRSSSYASRTMLLSGGIIALFVVYHLLHFTVRLESVNGSEVLFGALKDPATGHADVYAMMVAGFRVWYVSVFYVVAMGLLCLHLSHGVSALFQSLGLMNRAYRRALDSGAKVLAVVLFCGYVSIPVSIWVFGHGEDHLRETVRQAALVPGQEVK